VNNLPFNLTSLIVVNDSRWILVLYRNRTKQSKRPMLTKSLKNHGNKNARNPPEPDVADIQYLDVKSKQSPSKNERQIIDGYYFSDAKRKIDYVLVWEDNPDDMTVSKVTRIHREYRAQYVENLTKLGVEMELEVVPGSISQTHYLKLHIPWNLMCDYAELLCLRAPLQVSVIIYFYNKLKKQTHYRV
ncbi:Anoctamin-6, partial [Paragonimus heterotremus]